MARLFVRHLGVHESMSTAIIMRLSWFTKYSVWQYSIINHLNSRELTGYLCFWDGLPTCCAWHQSTAVPAAVYTVSWVRNQEKPKPVMAAVHFHSGFANMLCFRRKGNCASDARAQSIKINLISSTICFINLRFMMWFHFTALLYQQVGTCWDTAYTAYIISNAGDWWFYIGASMLSPFALVGAVWVLQSPDPFVNERLIGMFHLCPDTLLDKW